MESKINEKQEGVNETMTENIIEENVNEEVTKSAGETENSYIENNPAWQEIYASRQSRKILTGELSAVQKVKVRNQEEPIECAVVFYNGIKVLIPITEMNVSQDDHRIIRSMAGAEIDFIVIGIDSKNKIVAASRKAAMSLRRELELKKHKVGDIILARITGVGRNSVIAEAYGIETKVPKSEIEYGFINDLSEYVSVGDKVQAKIIELDTESDKISLSFKACKEDPFNDIIDKYEQRGEYVGEISGIQSYGLFVKLEQGVYALCPHPNWAGYKAGIHDKVLIMIKNIRIKERKIDAILIRSIKKYKNI